MKAIVAVDRNWGIGRDGGLLVSVPEDMKYFRETTKGAVVILGRKTLESFPGGRPLKGRVNIVLSRKEDERRIVDGNTELVFVKTAAQAAAVAENYPDRNVFVIGGESIYRLLLPFCEEALVTKLETTFPADTFFPNLDMEENWEKRETGEMREWEGLRFHFDRYRQITKTV